MDVEVLVSWLTEGLDPAKAAEVRAAVLRDGVKSKVGGLKLQAEWDTLNAQVTQFREELEGAQNNLGARAYREWYTENYPRIEQLQREYNELVKKSGGNPPPNPNPGAPPQGGLNLTPEELDKRVQTAANKLIQETYAPMWSSNVSVTSKLVQRHMRKGRTTDLDMDAISKIAVEKHSGNLEAAYDEWDKPEAEKDAKAAFDKAVADGVAEEMKKRNVPAAFPGGADLSPSTLSSRTKDEVEKFDRSALNRELAGVFANAG